MLELTKEQIQQLVDTIESSKTVIAVFPTVCVLFGLLLATGKMSCVLLSLEILHWFFLALSLLTNVVVR